MQLFMTHSGVANRAEARWLSCRTSYRRPYFCTVMDESSIKLESLDRNGSSEVLDTSQIIDTSQSNGMLSQISTSGVQLVPSTQGTPVSLPWVVPPYQMMLLPPGVSSNLFNNGNVLTLQDGHVLVTPYSDSGQINEATVQLLQQQQQQNQATSLMTQKLESELIHQQQLSVTESQVHNTQPQTPNQKTEKPKLPKKPLNTYMMFSKAIWPQVKAANSHLSSVTEIGAIVGAIWRELD
ncbi:hypothetical protein HELRODRAFT_187893, partial [Helobdella robusta]|uniref:HMG box domain-containing protein n=1 Tax=Helobdella robusta TaxID=6412 RepID=T1FPG3_HELRO